MSRGKVKSKMLLQGPVHKLNTELWAMAMATATCEVICIKQLLQELKFGDIQMKLCCDNQSALHIASNLVFMKEITH